MRLIALISSAAVLLLLLAGAVTIAFGGADGNQFARSGLGFIIGSLPFIAYFLSVVQPTRAWLLTAKVFNWLGLVFLILALIALAISSVGLRSNPGGIIGATVVFGVPLLLNLLGLRAASRRSPNLVLKADARPESSRAD